MRVISGFAKGRELRSPSGNTTRPITDRVKSALFNILAAQGMIAERRYLDLFGGTGAVGIEALSRGAAEAVFCERDPTVVQVLRHNLELTGVAARGRVVVGDAFAYLARPNLAPFDVIYIAPPQYQALWLKALRAVDARPELLTADGLVIVQIFPKEWMEPVLAQLIVCDHRRYGSTALYFFERSGRRHAEEQTQAA